MSQSILDQLNLTPQERRIVVGLAVVVFVVLNMLLVWPHFKDLGHVRDELANTRDTIEKENKEITKDNDPNDGYKKQLAQLQRQQGGAIPMKSQQVQLQLTVSDQARNAGVNVSEIRSINSTETTNNAYYEEQAVRINFESEEPQLINFLVNVGNDPAMIRVRELSLATADANRYRLRGDAVLSADYAKEPAAVAAPASGKNPPSATAPAKTPVPAHDNGLAPRDRRHHLTNAPAGAPPVRRNS